MAEQFVSRGFVGKRRAPVTAQAKRVPPGQYVTNDFPVLSAGPTPRVDLNKWTLTLEGLVRAPVTFSWQEFLRLPARAYVVDIHCVTKWTKLDTKWRGVAFDTLLEQVELDPTAAYLTASSYDGYTTNLPLPEVVNGQAFVAFEYDGKPLTPEHGGPARLLVPGLYFWKSAKWLKGIRFMENDKSGFWESLGYNNHGDPFQEQRYTND
jgi:DMSO/TMAO reductase YedYZ molybdopterin-dependent catalytic subunit